MRNYRRKVRQYNSYRRFAKQLPYNQKYYFAARGNLNVNPNQPMRLASMPAHTYGQNQPMTIGEALKYHDNGQPEYLLRVLTDINNVMANATHAIQIGLEAFVNELRDFSLHLPLDNIVMDDVVRNLHRKSVKETPKIKLGIISDGTNMGTRIVDIESGKEIERVSRIEWEHNGGENSQARITVEVVPVRIEVSTELIENELTALIFPNEEFIHKGNFRQIIRETAARILSELTDPESNHTLNQEFRDSYVVPDHEQDNIDLFRKANDLVKAGMLSRDYLERLQKDLGIRDVWRDRDNNIVDVNRSIDGNALDPEIMRQLDRVRQEELERVMKGEGQRLAAKYHEKITGVPAQMIITNNTVNDFEELDGD